tara:strand:+ start:1476 stop:2090 length:615 start_codon:yes stop_codon:yes gene_type:complete
MRITIYNQSKMFINEVTKIDPKIFTDNLDKIKQDYIRFRDMQYFFDYSHNYNLTADATDFESFIPEYTGYMWQVCPLVFSRKEIKLTPLEVRHSFTTDLLLAQDIKPILAVFSILEPGAELDPHADGDKRIDPQYMDSTVYKFHLSLDIPEDGDSALICGGETRLLGNGDLNIFDEEGEHYAYNKSSGRRGVLIVSYIKAEIDK